MAKNSASFGINLRDGATRPSRRMGQSLGFLERRLKGVEAAVDRLNNRSWTGYSRRIRQATRDTDRFRRSQAGMARVSYSKLGNGLKDVALAATAAGTAIAFVLGKKLYDLTDLAGRSQLAFKNMFGTQELGNDQLEKAVDLANKFGFGLSDTIGNVQKFNSLGFNPSQAEALVNMGGDMRALGRSSEEVRRVFLQLGQIQAKGKLQGEELIVLAENGVNLGMVYDRLGKKLGKTREEIIKMQGAGELKSTDALNSIAETILITLGKTKLGQAGEEAARNTLGGVVGLIGTRLETGLFRAAKQAEPALVKGLTAIFDGVERINMVGQGGGVATFLESVGTMLEKIGPKLPTIVDNFSKAFASASGLDVTGIDTLADKLPGIATQLGTIAGQMMTIAGYVGKIASIGDFFSFRGALGMGSGIDANDYKKPKTFGISTVAADDPLQKYSEEWAQKSHEAASQAGAATAIGLAQGIIDNSNIAEKAARGMGRAVDAAYRDEEEIHSPSRVARELGHDWGDGLAYGMHDSTDVVIGSARSLGQDTVDSSAAALRSTSNNYGAITSSAADSLMSSRNKASVSIGEVSIKVDGANDPEATAQATLDMFEMKLADIVNRLLE